MRRSLFTGGILLAALVVVTLLQYDWKPRSPDADYGACKRSHVENDVIIMWQSVCTGTSCTQVPYAYPTTRVVCDEREYPLGDGPAFQAAYVDYLKRLDEWHKRHPEKAP
ncbi:hypothetical protein QSH46_021770 [Xanthomonas arboricola pv. juglandis]|uniref:hypothetical protein n=1 Tax=Xanthomonas arboricola TaxID=56448 RepID=UPI00036DFFBA|nr:hypothetical protein [Xanthomonas arboricola]MDN0222723.1 hypothetical protein [Xanthomonas arboricola pv. juglandis]MDN0226966.1 hypothetical protein [Xanthomonas arboricola pv. juglandis]MDN0231239.1 hypothetical protein [Xanthomonas arboricola pv. juglandis]MDN0235490.1 hypothetical protein [Xanthomonas arboricola pv. juglandis]MDN0239735.1 hypothetical protein [Xanthomonas arboricola pv. juglandis]